MKYIITEAREMGRLSANMFAVIKNAGFNINDNGDKYMESVEIELDTIEDMERLISVVRCSVVVSIVGEEKTLVIYNYYIE